jgi:biopolymer transport protein ExbB/TolQ
MAVGSQYLNQIMHIISQSLMIPCYAFLLYFVVVAVIETGSLIGEMFSNKKIRHFKTKEFLSGLQVTHNVELYIANSSLPVKLKKVLSEFLTLALADGVCQRIIAQNFLSEQEHLVAKRTEKTELISKMGPLLGLMGTLIPLGPGLVGLGNGDFNMLAQYLIISFDATILGVFAGSLTFTISKIRRRWYEQYLNDLDAILETIIEVRENVTQTGKKTAVGGRL